MRERMTTAANNLGPGTAARRNGGTSMKKLDKRGSSLLEGQ